MRKSTLLFRSLAVVLIIAGSAHLISSYASQDSSPMVTTQTKKDLIGKWKVKYDSPDFKGSVVHEIKKENDTYTAYAIKYSDASGKAQDFQRTKSLTIKSFDNKSGTGIYTLNYEGQKYEVDCTIEFTDENTLKLSYDYYGYSEVEIWKKL